VFCLSCHFFIYVHVALKPSLVMDRGDFKSEREICLKTYECYQIAFMISDAGWWNLHNLRFASYAHLPVLSVLVARLDSELIKLPLRFTVVKF